MPNDDVLAIGREIALRPFRESGEALAGLLGVMEGTVYIHRSESADCVCCEGRHIHSIDPVMDGGDSSASMWIRTALYPFKHELNGRRIRLTLELLPE